MMTNLPSRTTSWRANGRRWVNAIAAGALLACGACSVLLNHDQTQCHADGDCTQFGGHPYCQSGVCVASGLEPADCFLGTPQQPTDFLNQCSTAECLSFDDCARLGDCADASAEDAGLVSPVDAGASVSSSTSTPEDGGAAAMPSCMDAANGRAQIVVITGSSNFPPTAREARAADHRRRIHARVPGHELVQRGRHDLRPEPRQPRDHGPRAQPEREVCGLLSGRR